MFRRSWILILCLLASSLIATATVHARETSGAVDISCSGVTHSENDTGEDGDQDAPHHHAACHGHNVTATPAVPTLAAVLASRTVPSASQPMRLARRTVDPALRPPQA